jgi:diguanylate cyclase (GGDEF)-like protein/PAS domain S-box-containing protein
MVVLLLAFTATIGLYSQHLMTQINELWGARFAEKQVLFDKHRALLPLMHEITLARQMATEPALIEMALHENDAASVRRGLEVLERYRLQFQDHSYFVALAGSGHYYFNDADNHYANHQLRYTLSPHNPNDRWFYATVASNIDYQINIDPDAHLGKTKVWINVALKHNAKVVGVIGTGLDITRFISEFVDTEQLGIRNLFVDRDLAIQLYRDQNLIDYSSITKTVKQRKKVDALLSDPADVEHLREVMRSLEQTPDKVGTLWVTAEGQRHLLGVVYLPEVGWFNLTLMNDDALTLLHDLHFVPILVLMFLAALVAVGLMLHRLVLGPIHTMGESVEQVQQGHYEIDPPLVGSGEIARLSAQFRAMVAVVRDTNRKLEAKVEQRTQQLSNELLERKHAENVLRVSETLLRTLYDTTSDAVMLFGEQGFFNCNRAALAEFGCTRQDQFHSKFFADLSPPLQPCGTESGLLADRHIAAARQSGSCRFDWVFRRPHNGMDFPAEVLLNTMELEGRTVFQAVVRDITERKKVEEQIRNLAYYDSLTQLPNRRMLSDRMAQVMAASKRRGHYAALMVLDLDNFKELNDTYGHAAGDALLVEVAGRLRNCVREADTVARFGGDEFEVMLSELDANKARSAVQAGIVAEKIRASLAQPYLLSVRRDGEAAAVIEHHCSSSIGVVLFINHEDSEEDLFHRADAAMYQAKEGGCNQIRFYGADS